MLFFTNFQIMKFNLTPDLNICIVSDLQSLSKPLYLDDIESISWVFKSQKFDILPIPKEIVNVDLEDFNLMIFSLENLKSIINFIPNITENLKKERENMIKKRISRVEKYLGTKLRRHRLKIYEDFADQGPILETSKRLFSYFKNYITANPDVSCPQLDCKLDLKRKLFLNMVANLGNVDYITSFTDSNIIDAKDKYKHKYSTVKTLRNKQ